MISTYFLRYNYFVMSDTGDNENNRKHIIRLFALFDKLNENGIFQMISHVNQTDYKILSYLLENNNSNPSVIAKKLNLTRSNSSASLKVLEKKDYIKRVIDKKNRRQVFVILTNEGREYIQICRRQLELLLSGWFSLLKEEEIEQFFSMIEKTLDPMSISEKFKELAFGS